MHLLFSGDGSALDGGAFGALGCKELNAAVDLLGAAIQQAEGAGVQSFTLDAARSFHERETGYFSSTWLVGSESCRNLVDQANEMTRQLVAEVHQAGGGFGLPVPDPVLAVRPPDPPKDLEGTIRVVAISLGVVVAGVALIALAGPFIAPLAAGLKRGGRP